MGGTRWTFTWGKDKRLLTASDGTNTISFSTNEDGTRAGKTVNGTRYDYIFNGSRLMREYYSGAVLDFIYDADGRPYALNYNGTIYYYILNLQGDVIRLVNSSGTTVASYEYDPYGKVLSATGSMAAINPLRYRGYYYDEETGLYYLMSRYYDPQTGRFINADNYSSTGQGIIGHNMFAYCGNNPVSRADDGGEFWNFVVGGVVGAVVGGVSAAISSYATTGTINWGSVALGAATGAIGGLIGASGIPAIGQAVSSGLLSAANNVGNALITGSEIDWGDVAVDFAIGAASSAIGSLATKKAANSAKSTISKGIRRVVSGIDRRDSGSRYWKGAVKRGIETISKGISKLNFAQGAASVIGSEAAGIVSITKTIITTY